MDCQQRNEEPHMKVIYPILLLVVVSLIALPNLAQAQDDHTVIMRFEKPVEIPGQVLPAGTYSFVTPEAAAGPLIQIFNGSRTHLIATVQAITATRVEPADKFQVMFGEGSQSASPAVVSWFSAGATTGYELVYPHREAQQLRASETTVPVGPLDRPVSGD